MVSDNLENELTASDDGNGNSALFVSRMGEVHDMMLSTAEHVEVSFFVSTYSVVDPLDIYRNERAVISPVGNRLFSFGDGDGEAVFIGKGPPAAEASVFPDESLYSYEWSRFPDCKFFVQGPKKTIFASGNPAKPLTIYISEPAGKTSPYRDTPYSTSDTNENAGSMSTVDILGSNASVITALSTRGDQVVVHTDKGCHVLYAPSSDQAETGYRVEQAPATNFSAAVNPQVVGGESGTMSYWLGHDGQVYKDESATRGAEDKKSQADPDQASWKAKGLWEKELPIDLREAFATYDPQSGMYWFYVISPEYLKSIENDIPSVVSRLDARPEIPGLVTNFEVVTVPGVVADFAANPELAGAVGNFAALPDIAGLIDNLDAVPEMPGTTSDFSATPALPGNVSDFDALPELPGVVSNFVTEMKPGVVSNLDATPELPGIVSNFNAVSGTVGVVSNLDATPELPGIVSTFNVVSETVGVVSNLDAKPELPGLVSNLSTEARPGEVSNFDAKPALPGQVSSFNTAPDSVGVVSTLDAKPALPGLVTNFAIPVELIPPEIVVGNSDDPPDEISFFYSATEFDKEFVNPGAEHDLYITRLQVSENADFSNPFVNSTGFSNLLINVNIGTTYHFRARFESSSSKYFDSEWAEISFTKEKSWLANPDNLTVTFNPNMGNTDSTREFTVRVDEVPNATSYVREVSTTEDFSGFVQTVEGDSNVAVFINQMSSTTYWARVKAKADNYFDSEWSEVVSYTTESLDQLDAPVISAVQVPAINDSDKESIKVSYTEVPMAEVYTVQRSTSSDFTTDRDFSTTPSNIREFVYRGLASGTTYFFKVKAHISWPETSWRDSEYSNVVSVTTTAAPEPEIVVPGIITNLNVEAEDTGLSCPVNDRWRWSWTGTKFIDAGTNADFDLNNTLFYTYVHPFKHAQTPWNGVHLNGGPFPNTEALAESYEGSGSSDTNIFWGSSPTTVPWNGGRSIAWNHSTVGSGSGTGPIYQMWHALKPGALDSDGMREYSADYTGAASPGFYNRNQTIELFRNLATGNMGINIRRGVIIDMSFVKSDNTDPCRVTGKYVEINSGVYWIYVGLRPYSPGANRMAAKHSNGETFELYVDE
jgi:hypothetical protein